MKPFNREKFLLWVLAGLLFWQSALFTFGLLMCSRVQPINKITDICPDIGRRYDHYVQSTLAAVLGLLAGSVALNQRRQSSSSDPDEPLASLPPQQLQQPSPEESVPAKGSARGRGKVSLPPEDQEPPRSSRKP